VRVGNHEVSLKKISKRRSRGGESTARVVQTAKWENRPKKGLGSKEKGVIKKRLLITG